MIRVDNLFLGHLEQYSDWIPFYEYSVGYSAYNAETLEDTLEESFSEENSRVAPFNVDLNGSKLIAVTLIDNDGLTAMLYQWVNNKMQELTPRPIGFEKIEKISVLEVPTNRLEETHLIAYPLANVDQRIIDKIYSIKDQPITNELFDKIQNITISPSFSQSYEALLTRLFNLGPVTLPDNFISFPEITEKLNQSQIRRWALEPMLQAFTTLPNNVLTFDDQNGQTYYVIAQYDSVNNRILAPV